MRQNNPKSYILNPKFYRAQLSKLKFALGLNPVVEKTKEDPGKYIPEGYKAVCLISADFEMAWAFRYLKDDRRFEPDIAEEMGMLTRKNVPKILDYCDQCNIPITWATVGHLFLKSCNKEDGKKHTNIPRIPYSDSKYWDYRSGDWFDADPCTDFKKDPAWYAPDLIDDILSRKVKHEIACHSFSHIDCSDLNCPPEVFEAEIRECQRLAAERGISLKSFVHPGHQIGHLEDLKKLGFSSYRTDYGNNLAIPHQHSSGLWELRNSAGLTLRRDWSVQYHIKRYKTIIDRAIKHRRVCIFWFHPTMSPKFVKEVFPIILSYLDKQRDRILSMTHEKYVEYLSMNN
jgi:hypothetical protein